MTYVDIIWSTTLLCPWDCPVCCVNAVQVKKHGSTITMWSNDPKEVGAIPFDPVQGPFAEQALRYRQAKGLELTYDKKLKVLENLDGFTPKIDISGGDPLIVEENYRLLQAAANRFGRHQITLTATGAGLAKYDVPNIAPFIGELNFTYDSPYQHGLENRPDGYANGNLKKATLFAKAGVSVRAECPLSVHNIDEPTLRGLYVQLHEEGIQKLLLMRLFPSGRGALRSHEIPSAGQYRTAIGFIRQLEEQFGFPKVRLQCALRFLDGQKEGPNPCDMLRESFGLLADGTLLLSPWAVDQYGKPLDDSWVIGNLAETPLAELLSSPRIQGLRSRLDENYGQCKVHAYLASARTDGFERMLDGDPLHSKEDGAMTAPLGAER